MLQVAKKIKFKSVATVLSLLFVLSLGAAVAAAFINTNRDTRPAPEKLKKSSIELEAGYGDPIYETDGYSYYFREDRDILAIVDKNQQYVWKTGLDIPFSTQIIEAADTVVDAEEKVSDENVKEEAEYREISIEKARKELQKEADKDLADKADELGMTVEQMKELAKSEADSSFMSDQYVSFANSLLSIEYYQGTPGKGSQPKVGSASLVKEKGDSSFQVVDAKNGKFKLECLFDLDGEALGVNLYITIGKDGSINYNVPFKEITGDGAHRLMKIMISPMLGASGGGIITYNTAEKDWNEVKAKELTPGYALIPDGSGSLIRFSDNEAEFSTYEGDVYGQDPSIFEGYATAVDNVVPVKNPAMPVFGISHGDGTQAAFVAYADKGDEYMTINAHPSTQQGERYTYAYAGFSYNSIFYQTTNQAGNQGYYKLQDEINNFDIDITYEFLSGDGTNGPKADYTGMAQTYRQHLIDEGILTETESKGEDIPIRIDFLMSDSKKGVFSTQEVAVTTASDVKNILNAFVKDGITNINSGLIGWQSGGETLAEPNSTSFSSSIGSESEFKDLMSEFSKKGIDISYSREFTTINEDMISYYNNAAKHMSSKYLLVDKYEVLPKNSPVTEFGYADPAVAANWMTELHDEVGGDSKSFTIDGASNVLISSYNSAGDITSLTESISLYQKAIKTISDKGTKLNLVNPNKYLWKYTDRYLQSPAGTSQYVYETDTVPFLQMVLHGTMEVYAPYSNFSFYSKTDMLRMIDYNISPSFVLTQEPSYLLAATTSADFYSTEFEQYEGLVNEIYNTVNEPLSQVMNYNWDSRNVYSWNGKKLVSGSKDANGNELTGGVIANQYSKDGNIKTIIINYTSDEITVNGTTIAAESAAVVEGGVE